MTTATALAPSAPSITVACPTINDVFNEFFKEQQERFSAATAGKCADVLTLLSMSLDGYGYMRLDDDERTLWSERWEQDEEEGAFCNTFGPEKVAGEIRGFLGYFLIRKVMGPQETINGAGTVIKKLASWMRERGYIGVEDTELMRVLGARAAKVLPRADKLCRMLSDLKPGLFCSIPEASIIEVWEPYGATISRIEPGKLWFNDDGSKNKTEVGPVKVPKEASELAELGWQLGALRLGRTNSGWQIIEKGFVYPPI